MKTKKESQNFFENDLKMLEHLQNEFFYRHTHYWNFLVKSFLLTLTITVFPLMREIFGMTIDELDKKYYIIFPIIGIVLSFACFFILKEEDIRVRNVYSAKNKLNKKMNKRYRVPSYNKSENSIHLSQTLGIILLIFELVIATVTIIIILTENSKIICDDLCPCFN